MADITLSRPAAQTRQTVPSAAEDRFVFDFPTGDATLSRDGDNLILTFDDGGSLELTDFYTTYNKENIPDFVVDGAEISGADFFTAMNEPDLMPAAGPAAGAAAGNGARYHEYANSSLAEGLDHLNGLDWGMNRPPVEEIYRGAVGDDGRGAEPGEPGAPIASTPVNHTPDIDTPVRPTPPDPNPDHPGNNDPNHPAWIPGAGNAHIVVDEGALPGDQGGSGQHNLHGYTGEHSFTVDVHGEPGGSIELTYDGQTVRMELPEDGATSVSPDGNSVLTVNGVEVTITGAELVDGKWQVNYEYELTGKQEHDRDKGHDTTLSDSIDITVTDGTGDVANGQLNVEVHDDVPRFSVEETTDATPKLDGSFDLHYGADGEARQSALTADGATKTEVNGDTTTFMFGDGVLTVTKGNDGSYSYEFMPNDPNVTFSKPITLTATDSDGDSDTITLTVGKTVPQIFPGKDPDPDNPDNVTPDDPATPAVEVGRIVVDEGDQPQHNDGLSHGKSGEGSFLADLNGENGTIRIDGLTITIRDGQVAEVTGSASKNGVKLSIDADDVSLTADGKWQVNYEYELTGSQKHEGKDDVSLDGAFDITVTDASGDTASGSLAVEVHDDIAHITVEQTDSARADGYHSQVVLDFTTDGGTYTTPNEFLNSADWDKANSSGDKQGVSLGWLNNVQIIASNVKYTYAEDGTFAVDQVLDQNGKDLPNGSHNAKHLVLTPDGLSVGFGDSWGGQETIGSNPTNAVYSEAVVLESHNKSVSYGMQIEFGHFEAGDKAVICFYLTPRNNNDDSVVYMKEVSYADLCDAAGNFTGKINIPVPDGFNKVIVSPLPTDRGDEGASSFTIKTIDLTRPAWIHEGTFEVDPGADGVREGSLTWAWDETAFKDGVTVKDAIGSGEYSVELIYDGTSVIARLRGTPDADVNLDGNILFKGTLDAASGTWKIQQFYNFDINGKDHPVFDVTFSVTDGDGDVTEVKQPIDAELPIALDRFQNVENGFWNDAWGSNATKDDASDVLAGTEVNDLMFGRGGNDLMFGDGGQQAFEDLKEVLGIQGTVQDIPGSLGEKNPGPNESLVASIKKALNEARGKGDEGSRLEEILKELEAREGDGGDDALFGGLGNDILFGGAGNDYLVGNGFNKDGASATYPDHDMLFGGSGNDIIVYDKSDFIVHGGSGIDVLLAGKDAGHLSDILAKDPNKAYVAGIEVLLRAEDTTHVENLGITSHETLAKYGVKIENDMLLLSAAWSLAGFNGDHRIYEFTMENGGKLTLETTLTENEIKILPDASVADAAGSPAAHVFMENTDDTAAYAVTRHAADGGSEAAPGEDVTVEAANALHIASPAADAPAGENAVPETAPGAPRSAGSPDAEALPETGASSDAALDDFLAHVDELGGKADEVLFGSDAGDFLAGAEGQDYIYAGAGDDLIVYDPTDYLIHGGDGIDVLLGGSDLSLSLEDMLQAADPDNGPIVKDVEVLIKGADALSLTSMDELAEKLGVIIDHEKGTMTLTGWTKGDSVTGADGKTYTTYTNGDVTLETTLTTQTETAGEAEGMVQQFTLQTING